MLFTFNASSQEKNLKPFLLDGTIGLDSGTVVLQLIADSNFYNQSARQLKSQIHNGKFSIKGEIPHPMAFMLVVENKYYSDMIIIKSSKQSIECHIDVIKEKLFVDTESKAEYELYKDIYKEFRKKQATNKEKNEALNVKYKSILPDSINAKLDAEYKSLDAESDQILLSFVKKNPESFLGLWSIIRLTSWGYEKMFDDAFAQYTDAITTSYAGKVLSAQLAKSGVLALGKKFPVMTLLDEKGRKSEGMIFGKNKYTLIDFWYTNCSPCRAQFPSFKNTYKLNHAKGFELIGISTDAAKYKEDLPKVIKELDLNWAHFWDKDGKETAALSIQAFPTNFLLDQEGTIIQKNIGPAELALFLENNL